MSKYLKVEDIKNALIELAESDKWLERETTMNIIKAFGCLPILDVIDDYISKEQAIEAIEGVDWYHINSVGELVHGSRSEDESWYRAEDIYKAIESVALSVVPKRAEGEWLPIIEGNEFGEAYQAGIYCSECGETLGCEANYCPNCGAKMKG